MFDECALNHHMSVVTSPDPKSRVAAHNPVIIFPKRAAALSPLITARDVSLSGLERVCGQAELLCEKVL